MCAGSSTIHDPTVPHCGSAPVRAKQPWWAGALGSLHLQGPGRDLCTWDSRIPCAGKSELAPRSQSASPPSRLSRVDPAARAALVLETGQRKGVSQEYGWSLDTQPGAPSWCGTRSSREEEGGFLAGQESTLHMAPCSRAESRSLPWNLTFQVILKA